MNNVSHNTGWGTDTKPDHVDPSPIPLYKEMSTGKSDGDHVKLKLHRDTTYSTSDLYEFRMSLFDHGDPEEFLFFVRNLQMNIAATGMIETEERFSIFVHLSVGKCYLSLTYCLLTRRIHKPP